MECSIHNQEMRLEIRGNKVVYVCDRCNSVLETMQQEKRMITIIDVGAGGKKPKHWSSLNAKIISFEPNVDRFDKIKGIKYNCGLWDKKDTLTLHITREPGLSSVLFPNLELLQSFGQKDRYTIIKERLIRVNRLDDIIKEPVDFLKVDVEGAALQVLKGAENTLKSVLGVEVEAEFIEKYKGQSLFSDVDIFLRRFNFQLIDMRICCWRKTPHIYSRSQPVHGDFIYFKAKPSQKIIEIACAYECYDFGWQMLKGEDLQARKKLSPSKSIRKRIMPYLKHKFRNER